MTKRNSLGGTGRVSCKGNNENAYSGFVQISEGKRPLGTPMHKIEDNIKMGIRERDDGWAWAGLLWLRIVTSDCCHEGNEPSGS